MNFLLVSGANSKKNRRFGNKITAVSANQFSHSLSFSVSDCLNIVNDSLLFAATSDVIRIA